MPSRYELGEILGAGGFGRVMAARDRLLQRDVAIKILHARTPKASLALERETSALRLLDLPGVVRLIDSGNCDGAPWFVMERIAGRPFPADGPHAWEALEPTVVALLRVLAGIHQAGFVHGDLKPSNVLVQLAGAPVILDLGLARFPGGGDTASRGGTPIFMAPEQRMGHRAQASSDVYAVGLMLFRALTGRWPDREALRRKGQAPDPNDDPCPFTENEGGVPPAVRDLIRSMLAADPGRRPAALACVRHLTSNDAQPLLRNGMASPAELARSFCGRERLHHVPSTAASIIWDRSDGDFNRMRRILEAWLLLGVANRTPAGLSIAPHTLERLHAGWAPENGRDNPWEAAVPGSTLSLCLSMTRSRSAEAATVALSLANVELSRGNLRAARVCLLEGLRECWRTRDRSLERALISAAVGVALADRSLLALDEAIDLIGRSRIHAERELDLLRAARALQDGRRGDAMAILEEPKPRDPIELQRARHDLRVQAVVNGPRDDGLLTALDRELEAWVAAFGADEQRHLHRWRARILYRQNRMTEAGREAERAVILEHSPFERLNALFAAAVAWIEAADVDRTMAIATSARALAAELRLPRLEARAELLMRTVLNRQGIRTEPDMELVEAARELLSPHIEGVIAVTEATIAWRSSHPTARSLAAAARSAFASAGYPEAGLFAHALEIASGAGDEAEANSLASTACRARRPDVAIEVLGLLALSGKLRGDWRDAFEEQARALAGNTPDWRSGALSEDEARNAVYSLESRDNDRSR